MLVFASISGAEHILRDIIVPTVCHLRPIVILSKRVVHTSLSGMSGNPRMMFNI